MYLLFIFINIPFYKYTYDIGFSRMTTEEELSEVYGVHDPEGVKLEYTAQNGHFARTGLDCKP